MKSQKSRIEAGGMSTRFILPGILALVAMIACISTASAATQTWTGLGTGNNMRQGPNWASGLIPAVGDDLVFAGSVRPTPNNNNSAAQGVFNSITFDSTATNFLIVGAATPTLTISNSIVNNSANLQTIGNGITLGANLTVNAASGNISLTQPVGDAGAGRGLTKTGTHTLTLDGTNTYTGATTISAGTLLLTSNGTIGGSSGVNLGTSGSQGTLGLTAKSSFAFGSNQTVSGYGTINIGDGKAVTISGNLAPGNSTGIINVTGDLVLGGNSTVTTMELGGLTAGTGFDKVIVSGAMTYDGTMNILSYNGWNINQDATYNLFQFASRSNNFDAVNVGGFGLGFNSGNNTWSGTNAGTTYTFDLVGGTLTVVPEPATWVLLAFSLTTVMVLRRRPAV